MAHGPRCARSVRHDLGPNIFQSGPPTQSISTYDYAVPGLRNSFLRRNVDQVNYHQRNRATDLTLPKLKKESLKRSFKFSGAMLWNQLSNDAKLAVSIPYLRSLLENS